MDEKLIAELMQSTKMEDLSESCRELAELIGLENVIKLSKHLVNDRLYVPSADRILMTARNKQIKAEYTGYNIKELAKKYDRSYQQIVRILKERE